MTGVSPELAEAIEGLYDAFGRYPLRQIIEGCPHCVGDEDQADLHVTPLRELTDRDLGRFAFKTMTTWGDTDDFRHFLPRLLELVRCGGRDAIDLDLVLGKLSIARWQRWPGNEQAAIRNFLMALWDFSLSADDARYGAEDLLDALARGGFDQSPFLAALSHDPSERTLLRVARMCRSAASGPGYLQPVRAWLASPATRDMLEAGFFLASSADVAADLSEAVIIAEALAESR